MLAAVKSVFPKGAKPSTVNRELYTPVIAILNMASKSKACAKPSFTRPKGYTDAPPIVIPDRDWFRLVLPHLSADKVALISFLTVHGRRLGDALGRTPKDFDPEAGTLAIGKDKAGNPLLVELAPGVRDLFLEMQN
jgi:integrase